MGILILNKSINYRLLLLVIIVVLLDFSIFAGNLIEADGFVMYQNDSGDIADEAVVGKVKKNFGWGKVFREYPVKCTFQYNNGSITNGYTRVYRYVGR